MNNMLDGYMPFINVSIIRDICWSLSCATFFNCKYFQLGGQNDNLSEI